MRAVSAASVRREDGEVLDRVLPGRDPAGLRGRHRLATPDEPAGDEAVRHFQERSRALYDQYVQLKQNVVHGGAARDQFIEDLGHTMVAWGLTRTTGRIYAYLLLRSAPASLDEMAEELDIAKSGASVAARQLGRDRPGTRHRVTRLAARPLRGASGSRQHHGRAKHADPDIRGPPAAGRSCRRSWSRPPSPG